MRKRIVSLPGRFLEPFPNAPMHELPCFRTKQRRTGPPAFETPLLPFLQPISYIRKRTYEMFSRERVPKIADEDLWSILLNHPHPFFNPSSPLVRSSRRTHLLHTALPSFPRGLPYFVKRSFTV